MIDLYLVRHAHAGNPANWAASDDVRPLTGKGLRQATRLADFLAAAAVKPDVLLTSPKLRALQTAEVLSAALGCETRLDERLAQGLGLDGLRAIIGEAGAASSLMLVGHDPDLSDLAGMLTGTAIALRKGTLVRIEVEREALSPGSGTLRWLIPPDAIGR